MRASQPGPRVGFYGAGRWMKVEDYEQSKLE